MIYLLVGALAGLLFASLLFNALLWFTRRSYVAEWRRRAIESDDRARAAELRSAQQIDAMLDRVSSTPNLELQAAGPSTVVDPAARTYVADNDDDTWNALHPEQEDEAE